jgi:plasmid stabilization system protein ParE
MKAARPRYSSRAGSDLASIVLGIAEKNPQAARALKSAIDATVAMLSSNPELGEVYEDPMIPHARRTLVTGYSNYSIYYVWNNDQLRVMRILHNARLVQLQDEE